MNGQTRHGRFLRILLLAALTLSVAGLGAFFACADPNPDAPTDTADDEDITGGYPHAVSWEEPEKHGAAVLSAGAESCAECHGGDFAGGWSNISCFSCHESYPHGANWGNPKPRRRGA
ncbi:MAG: hypothetical protein M5R36_15495 [Deltaproteobacteria bacterium]|nr:hypothetical protein [Deltaproteobacteria bacterium]